MPARHHPSGPHGYSLLSTPALADTLRTDRARLRPLTSDSPATVALRRACRARKDLVSHSQAVGRACP
jgi:hypothetical protein